MLGAAQFLIAARQRGDAVSASADSALGILLSVPAIPGWRGCCSSGDVGVSRFQDLVAWQLSLELCRLVFELTADGPAAADEKFRTQMRDAAQSAPALIAEGFVRFTTGEFIRYLRMARGEIGEIQSNLHVGSATGYFGADPGPAVDIANRAMATTTALLKSKLKQQAAEQRAKRDQKQARRPKRRSPGNQK